MNTKFKEYLNEKKISEKDFSNATREHAHPNYPDGISHSTVNRLAQDINYNCLTCNWIIIYHTTKELYGEGLGCWDLIVK